jgi:uncharacterized lipoprotein YbaY
MRQRCHGRFRADARAWASLALIALCTLLPVPVRCEERGRSLRGEILFSGLDALPWGSRVHIYLTDLTEASAGTHTLTERTITTQGEQIPIRFTLPMSGVRIFRDHMYRVCADIVIDNRQAFSCKEGVSFSGERFPGHVKLLLQRRY